VGWIAPRFALTEHVVQGSLFLHKELERVASQTKQTAMDMAR
jgi:hypothetical protein